MIPPTLKSERLCLRSVVESDVGPRYVAWLADPAVNTYLETRHGLQSETSIRAFVAAKRASADEYLWAICLPSGGRHIGNIKLGPIDSHHGRADVSLFIGERDIWGRGLASEAIRLVDDFAFATLGLEKLVAGAYAPNVASIRAFERQGWQREGVQRSHWMTAEGNRVDGQLIGLTRADWQTWRSRCP